MSSEAMSSEPIVNQLSSSSDFLEINKQPLSQLSSNNGDGQKESSTKKKDAKECECAWIDSDYIKDIWIHCVTNSMQGIYKRACSTGGHPEFQHELRTIIIVHAGTPLIKSVAH